MLSNDFDTDKPGRIPVLIATAGFFSVSILGLLANPDTPAIVRVLLSGALAITIYHGHNWARWLFLVLVILAELYIGYAMAVIPMPQQFLGLLAIFGLIHLVFVALLFVPSWGGQYYQSAKADPGVADSRED